MLQLQLLLLLLLPASLLAQEACHVQGQCSDALFVGLSAVNSYDACLLSCMGNNNCNWFTYNNDINECFLYADCPTIDSSSCESCYSGQVECKPEDTVCGVSGFCDGHLVAYNNTIGSASQCSQWCQKTNECQWYSYFSASQTCILTSDCTYLDQSCTDCTAGEKQCYKEVKMDKLMVIGGLVTEYLVEVMDLSEGGENRKCPPIPNHPFAGISAVGTFIDGKALVCGGYRSDDPAIPYIKRCFHFDPLANDWIPDAGMAERRDAAAGVMMSPSRWWVSGGESIDQVHSSSEIYSAGGFANYVDLPEPLIGHTIVQVNSSHFMLVGDAGHTNRTWMFDADAGVWSVMPEQLEPRLEPQAGLAVYPDGRRVVVVAGGYLSDTSEIFDLESMTWRMGPRLPFDLHAGLSVPWQQEDNNNNNNNKSNNNNNINSFLIVAGHIHSTNSNSNTIFKFNTGAAPGQESWEELPQQLEIARYSFAGFLVPEDFIQCN